MCDRHGDDSGGASLFCLSSPDEGDGSGDVDPSGSGTSKIWIYSHVAGFSSCLSWEEPLTHV